MGACTSLHTNSVSIPKLQMSSPTKHHITNNITNFNPINNNNNDNINDNKSSLTVDPQIISVGSNSKSRVSPFISTSFHRSFGGSKDETFYDTQAWLDSDCDEDFYSVNGDFSSRGSTPGRVSTPGRDGVSSSRYIRTFSPQVNRALFDGRPPLRSASNRSIGTTPLQRSISAASPRASTSSAEIEPASKQNGTKTSKKLVDLFRESIRERADKEFAFGGYASSPNVDVLSHTSRTNSGLSTGTRTFRSNYRPEKLKQLSKVVQCGCFPRLASRESKKAPSPFPDHESSKSVEF